MPCFLIVNDAGATSPLPGYSIGWAAEMSQDTQVAHGICPNCRILLVEASASTVAGLLAAVDRARIIGASTIVFPASIPEFTGQDAYDTFLNYPGVAFVAPGGDFGFNDGPQWPASSPYVTAVGGTSLTVGGGNGYGSETVWNEHDGLAGGSGCSSIESKPAFQADTGCQKRTTSDLAADASSAAVFFTPQGNPGQWFEFVGTSISSSIIGGMYGLAGGVPTGIYGNALLYGSANAGNVHDIAMGDNLVQGACSPAYLCHAAMGCDGPTGLGSPMGLGVFTPNKPFKVHATGPTGITGPRLSFTWDALSIAPNQYYVAVLKVDTNQWEVLEMVSPPSSFCVGGTCTFPLPGAHADLGMGTHLLFLNAMNGSGWTSWSDAVTVCVTSCRPGKVATTAPSAAIDTNTPKFTWKQLDGPIDSYILYDFSWSTGNRDIQQTLDNPNGTICSAGTYSWPASSPLPGGRHTFFVIGKNASGYGPTWSDGLEYFTPVAAGTGFDSTFNTDALGWGAVVPKSWILGSGFAFTLGVPNGMDSMAYQADFSTLDYRVRMARCASDVVVRGSVFPIGNDYSGYNGYIFEYYRDGTWGAWKGVNGSVSILHFCGCPVDEIHEGDAFDDLRVIANGSDLTFSINGVDLYVGSDPDLTSGWVGAYSFSGPAADGYLLVDSASLTTTIGPDPARAAGARAATEMNVPTTKPSAARPGPGAKPANPAAAKPSSVTGPGTPIAALRRP